MSVSSSKTSEQECNMDLLLDPDFLQRLRAVSMRRIETMPMSGMTGILKGFSAVDPQDMPEVGEKALFGGFDSERYNIE
jgi:hypothetical protein